MNDLLNAGLYHHSVGRSTIAVNAEKKPYHAGWNRYFTQAQTESEITSEFSNGAHGIALVLYPACDRVALDYDGPHAIAAWQSTGIQLPETARHITGSGGQHLFFRSSDLLKNSNLSRKVRLVRADCDCTDKKTGNPKPCGVDLLLNGYAIIPPTPGYREDQDHPFEEAIEIPDAIVELARDTSSARQGESNQSNEQSGGIHQGERNAALTRKAGAMRRHGMTYETILLALREENQRKCDPPLDDKKLKE